MMNWMLIILWIYHKLIWIKIFSLKQEKKENIFPMSKSHQFPFVGAAPQQQLLKTTKVLYNWNENNNQLLVIDIVSFKRYSNVNKFHSRFKNSFTNKERGRIMKTPFLGIGDKEFFIRCQGHSNFIWINHWDIYFLCI